MSLSPGPFACLVFLAFATGCAAAPQRPAPKAQPVALDLVPAGSLLVEPVKDPQRLLGAFVREGVTVATLDEAGLQRTACSQVFAPRAVPMPGEAELVLAVSPAAAKRWKLSSLARGSGPDAPMLVKVQFLAIEKRLAWAPERRLGACCEDRRDACTSGYVASALRGSGTLWVATQKTEGGPASPTVRYEHGMKWERAARFDDAFFAIGTPVPLQVREEEPEPD